VKLIEALEIMRRPVAGTARESQTFLACGFTPLHLQTFLAAELRLLLPEDRIDIKTGLFGDLCGNIERVAPDVVDSLTVVIEWGDLDQRLALRTLGGWRTSEMADILRSANQTAARLQKGLMEISRHVPAVVCMPTLPLPPMFSAAPSQVSSAESQLRHTVAALAAALLQQPRLRIVNQQYLDEYSPMSARYDVKSHVLSGFPYSLSHASTVAGLLGKLIHDRSPQKGLITDLDDTLWSGILGEDGADGVSWDLDQHSYMHGLYQQFVASLASAGVLVAVASKNDSANVERAFQRNDLLLNKNDIFPFEANWSAKSESVKRILKTWNVAADSVVFIDDSPMEVAEVKAAFPEMECLVFPKSDYQGVWNLLKHLRNVFGKSILTEDDTLRLRSIRESGAWRDLAQSAGISPDDFLKNADASVVFESVQSGDARSFELLNKTNQFNLNGKRYTESEWRNFFNDPDAFVLSVSYKDKFGSLGKIAVIMGTSRGKAVRVNGWVMSCRAFSRRIEHQCLKHLFETFGASELRFDYQATPRNGPLQEFFSEVLQKTPGAEVLFSKEQFDSRVPRLFHNVERVVHV
jgi:FkbH-like protein